MLVMGPFTVEVARALDMDIKALLISEVVVANFASFPSVVGSVPNLLIVFWAGISPGEMLFFLMPLSILLLLVTLPILHRLFGANLVDLEQYDPGPLMMIKPSTMIRSRFDFYMSSIGMGVLILGFVVIPQEVTFVSLLVASAMLAFSNERAKDFLRKLSWETIFFLIGLFGLVKALEAAGVIAAASQAVTSAIGSNPFIGIFLMIWIPGLVLSIIDNIPVAAFLSPMAVNLGAVSRVVPVSLIIGANVGGYMIPIGDAPNMIVISLCRENWKPLSFSEFTKITFQLGFIHLLISTAYCFVLALFI
jgi:Na+/H+ antiporter NhaD/arsenite permease-like protein